jgi:hypothetical protein
MPFDPEAYPTIPDEEIATPPPRRSKPPSPVQQQAEQAVNEYHQRVAETMKEQQAQAALMTEARTRFAKASLYEQILGGVVFEGTDHITAEVNAEFREFAFQKYCALLGIEGEGEKKKPKLSDEQIEVLSMMANSVLERAGASAEKPKVPGATPKVGKLAVVRRQPLPVSRPMPPLPPPVPMPVQVTTGGVPVGPTPTQPRAEQLQLPLGVPPGANIVEHTRPDGVTYKINRGNSQVIPKPRGNSPKPKPMPDENMQVALAAAEGDRIAQSKVIAPGVSAAVVAGAGGQ